MKLFVNQTCMSKILCITGELKEKVIHSIQSLWRIDVKQPVGRAIPSAPGDSLCGSYLGTYHTLLEGRTH